ncbi:MAG: WbqC family protein [Bacteroidota bacterium]
MRTIIVESQYLPGIAYFSLLLSADHVIIDGHEHYVRQTYRNRAEILGSNGVIDLTVPVIRSRSRQVFKSTKIDNTYGWQKIHWRGIRSSYGKSPFFEYYADNLRVCYEKRYDSLVDLNHDVMSCLVKLTGLSLEINYSDRYVEAEGVESKDYISVIAPKNKSQFLPQFENITYSQVFGNKFVKGLSLIDLLFCEGPNAGQLLRKMANIWQ